MGRNPSENDKSRKDTFGAVFLALVFILMGTYSYTQAEAEAKEYKRLASELSKTDCPTAERRFLGKLKKNGKITKMDVFLIRSEAESCRKKTLKNKLKNLQTLKTPDLTDA